MLRGHRVAGVERWTLTGTFELISTLRYASGTYICAYISNVERSALTTVGIRDLARRASAIVRGVRETGEPAIVTDRGRPVGVLYPIDADSLEDYVLANAPEFVTSMREADEDLAAGRTVSLDELLAAGSRG